MTRLRLSWFALGLLLIAWIGCYFPWVATTGAAFSVNLFDLAEWTSLDPAVRSGNPALLSTFLLRATVALIAPALAIKVGDVPNRAARWGLWLLTLLIGIGLLPPLDFFRGAFDDPNYQQQFGIALITVIGIGAIVFIGRRGTSRILVWSGTLLSIVAFLFGVIGVLMGSNELGAFGLRFAPGLGIAISGLALIGTISLSLLGSLVGWRVA